MRRFSWIVYISLFFSVSAMAMDHSGPEEDLIFAVRSGNVKAVRAELKKGGDINKQDKDGHTALMFSVMYGRARMAIVRALLSHGARVNIQAEDGMTALILAAGGASGGAGADAVKSLLDAGADPALKNNFGYTALMYAAGRYPAIAKVLQDRGAGDISTSGSRLRDRRWVIYENKWIKL